MLKTMRGFTLMELLIAIVVIGILAAVALPNYAESVRKARRADAMAALQAVQQAQERHRASHISYADTLSALSPPMTARSSEGHYTLSLSDVSASGYTVTATVAAGSAQASDARCETMSLTQSGGQTSYSSASGAACWSR